MEKALTPCTDLWVSSYDLSRRLWSLLVFFLPGIPKCFWLAASHIPQRMPSIFSKSVVPHLSPLPRLSPNAITPPQTVQIVRKEMYLRLVVLKTWKAALFVISIDLSPTGHLVEFLGFCLFVLPPKTNNCTRNPCLDTEIETEKENTPSNGFVGWERHTFKITGP